MRTWVKGLRGEHVAFTGKAWLPRRALVEMAERRGATATRGSKVTDATTILVRGDSSMWAHGDFGLKESQAAELIQRGIPISVIYDSEFRKLLESNRPARVAEIVAGEPTRWMSTPLRKQFEKVAAIDGELDREYTALGRMEQGYLRSRLFRGIVEPVCSLCGRKFPRGFLIAAHIKRRSDCSRTERLDAENIVFGLCLLGCDAAYERGLISVAEGGRVLVSGAPVTRELAAFVKTLEHRVCTAWSKANAQYFSWHRRRYFQGSHRG